MRILLFLLAIAIWSWEGFAATGIPIRNLPPTNTTPGIAEVIVDQPYPGHLTNDTFRTSVDQLFSNRDMTNLHTSATLTHDGTESWTQKSQVLSLGTNVLRSGEFSEFFLISPTNDATQVILSLNAGTNTVQNLRIINYTNGVPGNGAFTLPAGSAIANLPGGFVRLSSDWVATNGFVLDLVFQSPDWVEVNRWNISTPPGTINPTVPFLPFKSGPGTFGDSSAEQTLADLLRVHNRFVVVDDTNAFRTLSIQHGETVQQAPIGTNNPITLLLASNGNGVGVLEPFGYGVTNFNVNSPVVFWQASNLSTNLGNLELLTWGAFVETAPGQAHPVSSWSLQSLTGGGSILTNFTVGNDSSTFRNGVFVGDNSRAIWGGPLTGGQALVSIQNVANGDPNNSIVWSEVINGGTDSGWYAQQNLANGAFNLFHDDADGTPRMHWEIGNRDMAQSWDWGGTNFLRFNPGLSDGTTPHQLNTMLTHTTGFLLGIGNNSTNKASFAFDGAVSAGLTNQWKLGGQTIISLATNVVIFVDGQRYAVAAVPF